MSLRAELRTALSQLMNSNPEVASMLNNPELLLESMRMAGNPVRPLVLSPSSAQACGLPFGRSITASW